MVYPNNYLTAIHQMLARRFNLEELRTLCFNLGLDYDDLGGAGKTGKARELVLYLNRRSRIPELESTARAQRPDVEWPPLPGSTTTVTTSVPPTRIQLDPSDFEQLLTILQSLPQFATPDRRLDFLDEIFEGSPRKGDILSRFDASGMPRSAAVRLVNWLIQFGQDKPGRETLGVLIHKLLRFVGEGTNAQFLRGLLDRYPFGVTVSSEPVRMETPVIVERDEGQGEKGGSESTRVESESPGITLPPMGERFLQREDRQWLANVVGGLSRFQDLPGRRNLLIASQIPDRWIGEISLDRGGTYDVAETVINDLELRGPLLKYPQKHALGSLLETLAFDSFGLNDAIRAVTLIFRYQLNEDHEEINRLSERFGVPLMSFAEDPYQQEWQPPQTSLPAGLRSAALKENLEALYADGRENWLDVNFLTAGAQAARSVCRLEWKKRGLGTGFLVAPDLILTNYHVIQPPANKGELQARLRTCEVRFGAVSTPEGGVSAGNKVVKLHKDALVHSSGVEQLDYALLRLREPIEDGSRIVKATLSDEQIYEEQYANIVQHPLGGAMKVALRYNQVVKLLPRRVYYLSDTLEGSSGSPVFDDEWQVIALHRAGGLKDDTGQVLLEANEGVPILDILAEIKPYLPGGM